MVNEIDGCLFCVSLNDEILGLEQTVPWFSSPFTLLRVESDGDRVEKYVALPVVGHTKHKVREKKRKVSFRKIFSFSARPPTHQVIF